MVDLNTKAVEIARKVWTSKMAHLQLEGVHHAPFDIEIRLPSWLAWLIGELLKDSKLDLLVWVLAICYALLLHLRYALTPRAHSPHALHFTSNCRSCK